MALRNPAAKLLSENRTNSARSLKQSSEDSGSISVTKTLISQEAHDTALVRCQKGSVQQDIREMVDFNVTHGGQDEKGDSAKSSVKKSKLKARRNFAALRTSFYVGAKKHEDKKQADVSDKKQGDVSILSGGSGHNLGEQGGPQVPAVTNVSERDIKAILENIHPSKSEDSQKSGLKSLEETSYLAASHRYIHEPSVIQSLYFFVRIPSAPSGAKNYTLLTLASSVLANLCVTQASLADDLLVLGMYQQILKILQWIPPLQDDNHAFEQRMAIEKVTGLLANLIAKTKNPASLPYTADHGAELIGTLLKLINVKSPKAARAICICLRNVLQESGCMKYFLSLKNGPNSVCLLCKRAVRAKDFLQQTFVSFLAYVCFFSEEILPCLERNKIHAPTIDILLRTTSIHTRMECIRALSYLSVHPSMAEQMIESDATEIAMELLLECRGNPGSEAIAPREMCPQEKAVVAATLKYSVNLLCNLSLGRESVVEKVISDEKVVGVIFGILQEGDRTASYVQVKIASIIHNLCEFKSGRHYVASIKQSKDILRSQMSSTNKNLRDIVSKTINDLRDERTETKAGEPLEEEALEKLSKRRERVMNELMHTERTYVDHLLQMVALFLRYKAISQDAKSKVDASNATEMHANVEGLSSVHFKFLQELEKLQKGEDGPDGPRTLGGVVEEFLVQKLDIYKEFTRNFEKYQAITDEKPFRKFLESERKAAAKTNKKRVEMTPQSLLITPIQRVPRYVLLLEDLLDHMSPDQEDYESLNRCFLDLMEMMEYLEDEKARMEAVMKVTELEKQLTKADVDLTENRRTFLREQAVFAEDPRYEGLIQANVFLLSDLFVFAVPRGNKFKCKMLLPLFLATISGAETINVEIEDEKTLFGFTIASRCDNRLVSIYLESGAERDMWLSALREAQQADNDNWQCHESENVTAKIHTSDSSLLRQLCLNQTFRRITLAKSTTVKEAREALLNKLSTGFSEAQTKELWEDASNSKIQKLYGDGTLGPLYEDESLARQLLYVPTGTEIILQNENVVPEKEIKPKKSTKLMKGSMLRKNLNLSGITGGKDQGGETIASPRGGSGGGNSGTPRGADAASSPANGSVRTGGGKPSSGGMGMGMGIQAAGQKLSRVYLPDNTLIQQLNLPNAYVSIFISSETSVDDMRHMVIKACTRGHPQGQSLKALFHSYNIWVVDGKEERVLKKVEQPFAYRSLWQAQSSSSRNSFIPKLGSSDLPTRRFAFYPLGDAGDGNDVKMGMGGGMAPATFTLPPTPTGGGPPTGGRGGPAGYVRKNPAIPRNNSFGGPPPKPAPLPPSGDAPPPPGEGGVGAPATPTARGKPAPPGRPGPPPSRNVGDSPDLSPAGLGKPGGGGRGGPPARPGPPPTRGAASGSESPDASSKVSSPPGRPGPPPGRPAGGAPSKLQRTTSQTASNRSAVSRAPVSRERPKSGYGVRQGPVVPQKPAAQKNKSHLPPPRPKLSAKEARSKSPSRTRERPGPGNAAANSPGRPGARLGDNLGRGPGPGPASPTPPQRRAPGGGPVSPAPTQRRTGAVQPSPRVGGGSSAGGGSGSVGGGGGIGAQSAILQELLAKQGGANMSPGRPGKSSGPGSGTPGRPMPQPGAGAGTPGRAAGRPQTVNFSNTSNNQYRSNEGRNAQRRSVPPPQGGVPPRRPQPVPPPKPPQL
mmetsp:Transcript_24361/g.68297  ORF Transcript_24361/g.68297 Transcript_24361/m.68297 type:complete len:1678 (+) Transcript_24361:195-5228(+)